jgi:hypothetical protein
LRLLHEFDVIDPAVGDNRHALNGTLPHDCVKILSGHLLAKAYHIHITIKQLWSVPSKKSLVDGLGRKLHELSS